MEYSLIGDIKLTSIRSNIHVIRKPSLAAQKSLAHDNFDLLLKAGDSDVRLPKRMQYLRNLISQAEKGQLFFKDPGLARCWMVNLLFDSDAQVRGLAKELAKNVIIDKFLLSIVISNSIARGQILKIKREGKFLDRQEASAVLQALANNLKKGDPHKDLVLQMSIKLFIEEAGGQVQTPEEDKIRSYFSGSLSANVKIEALALLRSAHLSGRPLLFTRNISLSEFDDIVSNSSLRLIRAGLIEAAPRRIYFDPVLSLNVNGRKDFRYGLGHEYGIITIVMKPGFWSSVREKSGFDKSFLPFSYNYTDNNDILKELSQKVLYNRMLQTNDFKRSEEHVGKTIMGIYRQSDLIAFMGHYPQLEVPFDIDLDQVECIMVPQHMWEEVSGKALQNPKVYNLLRKVEGTGATVEEFLEGRDLLGRRSSQRMGGFEPQFGYDSFHRFEQEYFKIVMAETDAVPEDFIERAKVLIDKYGYTSNLYYGWLWANRSNKLKRNSLDWKIFVNPREENFFRVFEEALQVLDDHRDLGIRFKILQDFSSNWRDRKFSASNTPKIIVYVNENCLPDILHALDERLKISSRNHGFGSKPGPAFSKRYGETDLVFYKMEVRYVGGKEERAYLADQAEDDARLEGITDEAQIWDRKELALRAAGFTGENFYRREFDIDPVGS